MLRLTCGINGTHEKNIKKIISRIISSPVSLDPLIHVQHEPLGTLHHHRVPQLDRPRLRRPHRHHAHVVQRGGEGAGGVGALASGVVAALVGIRAVGRGGAGVRGDWKGKINIAWRSIKMLLDEMVSTVEIRVAMSV